MRDLAPEVLTAILRSIGTPHPDPRVDAVLADLRREWQAIMARRFPDLGSDREDVLQLATLRVLSPEKLAALEDPRLLRAWARSIFVNAAIDVLRDRRRERRHRIDLATADEDAESILRNRLPTLEPTPEQHAQSRERVRIAATLIEGLAVARARFFDELPENRVAERFGLSRDAVAGQLRRLRRRIRTALGDLE